MEEHRCRKTQGRDTVQQADGARHAGGVAPVAHAGVALEGAHHQIAQVTGAVGLLDRVAPLCFAAPVFFHSVRWYFQLKP